MAKKRKKRKNRLLICLLVILLCIIAFSVYNSNLLRERIYPLKYSETVDKYSELYHVEKALIYAVIKAESGFDQNAKSNKDAYGLMQITEDTMIWLKTKIDDEKIDKITIADLYDPEINIMLGTFLLKNNIDKYNDLKTALCAYNAGIARTDQWLMDSRYSQDGYKIDVAAYKETEDYSNKVIRFMNEYRKLYYS